MPEGHEQVDQHIHVGVSEGEEREKGHYFFIFEEIMAENVPNFMKDMNINIQKLKKRKTSKEKEFKEFHTQIIIIKFSKVSDKKHLESN